MNNTSMFTGKSYAGNWQVKSVEAIPEIDKQAIESAHIVNSQYGLSVCFMMKAGNRYYKALDTLSNAKEGDVVNLETAKLVTLSRQGDADIQKIRVV